MSGSGPVGNTAASRPFSNFVQNNGDIAGLQTKDRTGRQIDANRDVVGRLYINSRGELQRSSNAISHAWRKLVGKTQGAQALHTALTRQVGEETARHFVKNLVEETGNLRSLKDIDYIITNKVAAAPLSGEKSDSTSRAGKAADQAELDAARRQFSERLESSRPPPLADEKAVDETMDDMLAHIESWGKTNTGGKTLEEKRMEIQQQPGYEKSKKGHGAL